MFKIKNPLKYKKIKEIKTYHSENDGLAVFIAAVVVVLIFITGISYINKSSSPIFNYLSLAQKEIEKDNYQAAEKYYNEILQIDPTNSSALKGLIILHKINKDYFQVKKDLDILLSKGEAASSEYVELGKIFLKEIDYTNAIECLQKAINIKPGKIEPHVYLSQCYLEREDYTSVIREGKEILKISDSDLSAHINIATAYHKMKDYETGLKWYEKALVIDPENTVAIYGKEECYKEVRKKIEEALKSSDELVDKGNLFYKEGNFSEAADYYTNALYKNPSNVRALYNLANCHYAQGNYEEALNYYNKVLSVDPNHSQANTGKGNVQYILGE